MYDGAPSEVLSCTVDCAKVIGRWHGTGGAADPAKLKAMKVRSTGSYVYIGFRTARVRRDEWHEQPRRSWEANWTFVRHSRKVRYSDRVIARMTALPCILYQRLQVR